MEKGLKILLARISDQLANANRLVDNDELIVSQLQVVAADMLATVSELNQALLTDVYLPVPWISQWDKTAALSSSDCGPTCVAMIDSYVNKEGRTPDFFTRRLGLIGKYSNAADLEKGLVVVGVDFLLYGEFSPLHILDQVVIMDALDSGWPVIALVNYAVLNPKHTFKGLHWIVICGYTDDSFIVNDPLPKDEHEGHVYLNKSLVLEAMERTKEKGAQQCHGLVVIPED